MKKNDNTQIINSEDLLIISSIVLFVCVFNLFLFSSYALMLHVNMPSIYVIIRLLIIAIIFITLSGSSILRENGEIDLEKSNFSTIFVVMTYLYLTLN